MVRTRSEVGRRPPAPNGETHPPASFPTPDAAPPPPSPTAAPVAAPTPPDAPTGRPRAGNGIAGVPAAPTDRITATFPEEVYCPRPYNTFRVGPYVYETSPRDGETAEQAFRRALAAVHEIGVEERRQKFAEYKKALAEILGSAETGR